MAGKLLTLCRKIRVRARNQLDGLANAALCLCGLDRSHASDPSSPVFRAEGDGEFRPTTLVPVRVRRRRF
jgi:hypothetical protein